MKLNKIIFPVLLLIAVGAGAQQTRYSQVLAQTAMRLWPDSISEEVAKTKKWSYDQGVVLKGIEGVWKATGDARWFRYIQRSMDQFVMEDGTIRGYRPDEYNIDHINNGKLVLMLWEVTGKEKYRKAADLLRSQLRTHPRTSEGGFWHKKIYPYQMWLDGLYMGQPFYAQYARAFGEDTTFNDVTRQFVLMERHARDPKTGLLYHGWDESRQQKWANPSTGLSPHFWGRALGWYGMAMVDALDYFPANHPGRDSITGILNRFAKAVVAVQDPKSGLWYDIVDMPNEKGNYLEASASAMIVYTLAKGINMGYLPVSYLPYIKKAYDGILREFVKMENGQTNFHGTVSVSGLGGNPYRDGSFAYYMSEKVVVNDGKGLGAFINAAVEVEKLNDLGAGKGKTVVLDNFFNNEWKKDVNGKMVRWHYTWDEMDNGGFSLFGDVFRSMGAATTSLTEAPTAANLKKASVYIIVDADTEKETTTPNVLTAAHASVIADWVRSGGVLVLMGNDAGNANLNSMNEIGSKFGIHFNEDNYNLVKNDQFEQGVVSVVAPSAIFKTARKLYVKELSTLSLTKPANAVVTKDGKNVMAVARYGRGTVFAIGDPWLYNEYIDGRKLPADFDNYKATRDLAAWLLKQTPKK